MLQFRFDPKRNAAARVDRNVVPVSAKGLATEQLNRNAVRFGEQLRSDAGESYPYLYGFVPDPQPVTDGDNGGNPSLFPSPSISGVGPDGYVVEAGTAQNPGMRDIPIRLDRDLNYDLLEVRYSVRYVAYGIYTASKYQYMTGSNVALSGEYTADITADKRQDGFPRYFSHPFKLGTPVYENVKVSLYAYSGVARSIYGGMSQLNRNGNNEYREIPADINTLQGLDDGKGSLRTPHLLAKESVVLVRVYNYAPNQVRINGCLFGYKVAH